MNRWRKLLAMLLVVLMCMSITPQQVKAAEDYRTWSQADERWGSLPLGSSDKTVKSSGCLVTSIAKLMIQCGLKDDADFNPAVLVKWMNKNGGFSGSSLVWAKPAEYLDGFSLYSNNLYSSGNYSIKSYTDDIIQHIKDGLHIVLQVKNGGHWVAVDEAMTLANGEIYIMDTLTGKENADLRLKDRYDEFNRAAAYKGGTTPSPEADVPELEAPKPEETPEPEAPKPEETPDTEVPEEIADGWVFKGDNWYYYSDNQPLKGWNYINQQWYYFNSDGKMQTGWLTDNAKWYYLDDTGAMVTGWMYKDGTWYYLDTDGAMYVGWLYQNDQWYYFADTGNMHTGWLKWRDQWYYMQEDGSMAADTIIDGYYIDKDGVWVQE